MASIGKDKNGRRRILFVAADGKRKTIRLGKVSQRVAEATRVKVEHLIAAKESGVSWDGETARWVAKISDSLASRLAAVGLIPKRACDPTTVTLGPFLDSYIMSRAKLKPNTRRNYDATSRHLTDHFGREQVLNGISPGEADEWREAMLRRYSVATVSREVKRARQFFNAAVRKRIIAENPFADLPAPLQVNSSREHFVSIETIEKVLAACPNAEWRLIIALSRFGGLRCPSEITSLTWGDIDWNRKRLTVKSPKTEHHAGGDSRIIPIFPELQPHLEAAFDAAEVGSQYVIERYRNPNTNLRSQMLRIISKAGVKPWPKPFHNLRASRQTELTRRFPLHVVCEWIGNSAPVADKHYLMVNDADYEEAITFSTVDQSGTLSGTVDVPPDQKAAQNQAQHSAATPGTDSQETKTARENRAILLIDALACDSLPTAQVPPRGVEPLSSD